MQSLLIKITYQLPLLKAEQLIIRRLQFKLSNQMRQIKSFHHLRKCFSLIDSIIKSAIILVSTQSIEVSKVIPQTSHLHHLTIHLAPLVREQIKKHFLVQFHLLLYGILARLHSSTASLIKNLILLQQINGAKYIVVQDDSPIAIKQSNQLIEIIAIPDANNKPITLVESLFETIKIKSDEESEDLPDYEFERQPDLLNQLFNEIKPPSIKMENEKIISQQINRQKIKQPQYSSITDDIFKNISIIIKENDKKSLIEQEPILDENKLATVESEESELELGEIKDNFVPPIKVFKIQSIEQTEQHDIEDQQIEDQLINDCVTKNRICKYRYLFKQQRKRYLLR